MFKITDKGEVFFSLGKKPASVNTAQREVREIFMTMVSAGFLKRVPVVTAEYYLALGELAGAMAKTTPHYPAILNSAARAYCLPEAKGLAAKKMWSMDVVFGLGDLEYLKDLPEGLVPALRASGQTEFRFMARPC